MHCFLRTGAILIVLAIAFGAFGAHGLEGKISTLKIASFEVGIRYQIYHGLALILFAALTPNLTIDFTRIYYLILSGVILFSGSIYLLALSDLFYPNLGKFIWPLTPLGGLLLIWAWLLFLWKLRPSKLSEQ